MDPHLEAISDQLAKLEAELPMTPENLATWTIVLAQLSGTVSSLNKRLEDCVNATRRSAA